MKYVRGSSPADIQSTLAAPDHSHNGHSATMPQAQPSFPEPKPAEFDGHRVIWSCASCMYENDEDSNICVACHRERFAPSNSVPMASAMTTTIPGLAKATVAPSVSSSIMSGEETSFQENLGLETEVVSHGEAAVDKKVMLAAQVASDVEFADEKAMLASEVVRSTEAPDPVIAAEVSAPVAQEGTM